MLNNILNTTETVYWASCSTQSNYQTKYIILDDIANFSYDLNPIIKIRMANENTASNVKLYIAELDLDEPNELSLGCLKDSSGNPIVGVDENGFESVSWKWPAGALVTIKYVKGIYGSKGSWEFVSIEARSSVAVSAESYSKAYDEEKIATITDTSIVSGDAVFELKYGVAVNVRMAFPNSVINNAVYPLTLNVNGTGSIPVKKSDSVTDLVDYKWVSGSLLAFMYDGNSWIIDSYMTPTKAAYSADCSTEPYTREKVVVLEKESSFILNPGATIKIFMTNAHASGESTLKIRKNNDDPETTNIVETVDLTESIPIVKIVKEADPEAGTDLETAPATWTANSNVALEYKDLGSNRKCWVLIGYEGEDPTSQSKGSNTVYTVVRGDTLSRIAVKYNTTVNNLLRLNPDIENKDLIYVGQKIIVSGNAATKTTNRTLKKPTITAMGLQSSQTDNTLFVTWAWDADHTDHYLVRWTYATGVGVGFIGSESEETYKQSVYTCSVEGAVSASVQVKPISKTYKDSKDRDVHYWTADWSTIERYYFSSNPPSKPQVPDVKIENNKLTATVIHTDEKSAGIRFQVMEDDRSLFDSADVPLRTTYASFSCGVELGHYYKVRCRAYSDNGYSDWTEYSSRVESSPAAPEGINALYALSGTAVGINWTEVTGASSYEIQYTNVKRFFDSNPSGVQSVELSSLEGDVVVSHAEITGLTSGLEYFFRVRAKKENANSEWTEIKSLTLGERPAPPTTWSSASTVVAGEPLKLYWIHNSSDESSMTESILKLEINGSEQIVKLKYGVCMTDNRATAKVVRLSGFSASNIPEGTVVKSIMTFTNTLTGNLTLSVLDPRNAGQYAAYAKPLVKSIYLSELEGSNTCYWGAGELVTFEYDGANWVMIDRESQRSTISHSINTSAYESGTKINWQVMTAGVLMDEAGERIFSNWSVTRTVDIYGEPTMTFAVTDDNGILLGDRIEIDQSGDMVATTLTSFPFRVKATAGPASQKPTGYHISIVANEPYETIDIIGRTQNISKGTTVYSKFLDVSDEMIEVSVTASDVNLMNNISYTVHAVASMNSGLTVERSQTFTVAWADDEYNINAEISYDPETCTAIVGPYCVDDTDTRVAAVLLSVYRREYDGSFVELATGLDNTINVHITDPHPSLDYARYRVVAISEATGNVYYNDIPGYPINEKAAIIQWDEDWNEFDVKSDDPTEQPAWAGSLLRLPYNLDVSDNHSIDVELVKYIGRDRPVSYYGTQVGHSSNWSMAIPKNDKSILYALRRLAIWKGDVYVREPSGSGYWANVSVSFNQKHRQVTIPVTLTITRVEGGK